MKSITAAEFEVRVAACVADYPEATEDQVSEASDNALSCNNVPELFEATISEELATNYINILGATLDAFTY